MLLSKVVQHLLEKNDQQIWNHFWNFEKSVSYKEWRFITQKLHNYDETFKMFPWKTVVSYEENSAPGYKRSKGQLTILFSCNIAGKKKLKFSFIVKLKIPIGVQKYSSSDTSSMVQQLKMQLNRLRNFMKIFYWIFPTVKSFLIKKVTKMDSVLTTLMKRNLRVTDEGGEMLEKLKKWNLKMLFTGAQAWEKIAQNTRVSVRKVTWSGKTNGR